MNNLTRNAIPCLLAAGGLVLSFSTFNSATAGDVPEVSADNIGPVAAAGIPGLFGKGKAKAKGEAKGKAKGEAKGAAKATAAPAPEPNLELRAGLGCIDGFLPTDVQKGTMREYDVKEGMNVSQRSGFMDRAPVEMTNGCFLGELKPSECFAFTVKSEKYAALGNSNDWEVQCVYSDDPGAGAIGNKDEYPYSVDRMPGKAMMLLCGHSEGDAYECDEGSNSARGGVWQKKLEATGKEQLGFCNNELTKQSVTYDTDQYPSGRWVYCQYYNKQSKKNLFGYEFLQTTR